MVRKLVLTLAAVAAFIPSIASAGPYGYDVRRDVQDIRHDRADLQRDRQDLRHDLATGHLGAAYRDAQDIHRDRQDLHRDYRDLNHDINRRY
jgi:hypothetical protein